MDNKYPKYFKTAGQMQAGKLGPMVVNNGIIEVLNAEQEEILKGLQTYKDKGIIQVGLGQSIEILPNGTFNKITVPNRFATAFTEAELLMINNIPDDVFEETVLFNIREIAKEYSDTGKDVTSDAENSGEGMSSAGTSDEGAEQPAKVTEPYPFEHFKDAKEVKQRLEELGIAYPNNANKQKAYEAYTQYFEKQN